MSSATSICFFSIDMYLVVFCFVARYACLLYFNTHFFLAFNLSNYFIKQIQWTVSWFVFVDKWIILLKWIINLNERTPQFHGDFIFILNIYCFLLRLKWIPDEHLQESCYESIVHITLCESLNFFNKHINNILADKIFHICTHF